MLYRLSLMALAVPLIGCTKLTELAGDVSIPVTRSVAVQALGAYAYSIDPFSESDIKTPGIYNVRDGQARQICEHDTSQIARISNMRRTDASESRVNETLEDSTANATLDVRILGVNWQLPYRKIRVRDYNITRVYSDDSRSAEDWILDNVADKCRETVLDQNRPYIVVTSVATAIHVETVSGGGDIRFSIPFILGTVSGELAPYAQVDRRNRVFAVSGRLVTSDN